MCALTVILYCVLKERVQGSVAIGDTRKIGLTMVTEMMVLIITIYPKYDDTKYD
jgi:hypothetical protein